MASLYDFAGGQYTATTGRKRNIPYRAFIDSRIPSIYQSKARQENTNIANSQLELDAQAIEESKRASEASIEESQRVSDIEAQLARDRLEEEKKQAMIGNALSGAQTVGLGYYAGSKLGLFGKKKVGEEAAKKVISPVAKKIGSTSVAQSGAASGAAKTASAGYGSKVLGRLGPAAIGYGIADVIGGLRSKVKEIPKEAENTGKGAALGFAVGGPIGGLIGGGLGLASSKVKELREPINFIDSAIDKTVDFVTGNTWICTKVKEMAGMSHDEWYCITKLKRYSITNHKEWIKSYMEIGPSLVESINGDDVFYKELKESFVVPIIRLVGAGFMDAAYLAYKSVVIDLVKKYNVDLLKEAPEEI